MRIYDVRYAHQQDGENFTSVRVAVRGYVPEAIKIASQHAEVRKFKNKLRVEAVILVASTER